MKYIITESQAARLKRRTYAIDELIKWFLNEVYNPERMYNFYEYYSSPEMLYDVIGEAVIERIYYDYFGDLEDDSEDWGEVYDTIVQYTESVWRDKIISHYKKIWKK